MQRILQKYAGAGFGLSVVDVLGRCDVVDFFVVRCWMVVSDCCVLLGCSVGRRLLSVR